MLGNSNNNNFKTSNYQTAKSSRLSRFLLLSFLGNDDMSSRGACHIKVIFGIQDNTMLQVMHEGKLIQILPVMDVNHQKHLALMVHAQFGWLGD